MNRSREDSVVIRFAGDSGDGMQLTGGQFTETTAIYGNDLATFPDFPAEIRAPAGALFGVSAFQIHFGSQEITTAGDTLSVLVAMNPAALKTNLSDLPAGGMLIVDRGAFTGKNLKKAGYHRNPIEDGSLTAYQLLDIDITKYVLEAVKSFDISHKSATRCKNMWVLGLAIWLYGRDRRPAIDGLRAKFANNPTIRDANIAALNAGHAYAETAEFPSTLEAFEIPATQVEPGLYRNVTGTEAMAWGLIAAGHLAGIKLTFASYPITPASNLLHTLAGLKEFNVVTFQAEDEIAAACAAIGASYAGSLGVTSSSGPGISLKGEAISLACSAELPLVVINTQRGGPSTGLPTKTEQSDLNQALFGRHADTPVPVIAASTPADCFHSAIEAVRLATKYMTPVLLLSDGYLANAAEPWKIPDINNYSSIQVVFRTEVDGFHPVVRDEQTLARAWAIPGTPGLEHRIGGIEKSYDSGNISYDPANHQRMTDVRINKITGIAKDIPEQQVALGPSDGRLVVVGWGSTWGAIHEAIKRTLEQGIDVSHIHIKHLWPLPANLGDLLSQYDIVMVAEMNNGQLRHVLRAEYLLPVIGVNKVAGQPFKVAEIKDAIDAALRNE